MARLHATLGLQVLHCLCRLGCGLGLFIVSHLVHVQELIPSALFSLKVHLDSMLVCPFDTGVTTRKPAEARSFCNIDRHITHDIMRTLLFLFILISTHSV